jgi:glycosyltransferase involved in cell wall biosynthesis
LPSVTDTDDTLLINNSLSDFIEDSEIEDENCFIFLSLGIICPRKNQVWAVQLFKKFAKNKANVKLIIVGARYNRKYEIEYLDQVKLEIGNDVRIEIHDVTSNVDHYYRITDCLLFTSVNEVTPMVISEAMSFGIPILSTNIAGIPEMLSNGIEGYLFVPYDDNQAIEYMNKIFQDEDLRYKLGQNGIKRFTNCFDLRIMVELYRNLILNVAPPIILLGLNIYLSIYLTIYLTIYQTIYLTIYLSIHLSHINRYGRSCSGLG